MPRNISIDILKFLAVLFITNSHMDMLYGEYSYLATGGAIGDALFFFISGFTIFLGRDYKDFGNYYKRRINRIYPTVFAWAMISSIFLHNNKSFIDVLITGGSWFVSCIMIYYVFLYFIRKHLIQHLKIVFFTTIAISLSLYPIFREVDTFNIYGDTYYKWVFFFCYMLQGAILGLHSKQNTLYIKSGWLEISKVLLCTIAFYAFCYFKTSIQFNYIQLISLIPLFGIIYYLYRWCNSDCVKSLFSNKIIGNIISIIGGLCLEVYLVQSSIFTDKLNFLFPLNILIIFAVILVCAYLLRGLSRVWAQTFKDCDYNWKEVFKIHP